MLSSSGSRPTRFRIVRAATLAAAAACAPFLLACGTNATSAGQPASVKCSTEPMKLVDFVSLAAESAATFRSAVDLAVDGTNVYFVFDDALMSVPIRGGPIVTMESLPTPKALIWNVRPLVTSTSVIVHFPTADSMNEAIVGVPKHGGNPVMLATSQGTIGAYASDGHDVYFVDDGGTKGVPVAGGDVRLLTDRFKGMDAGGFGGSIGVVGSNLVVTGGAQGGVVLSIPLAGGTPVSLAIGQPNASFPMPCASSTCWWTGRTPDGVAGTGGPGAIERLGADGHETSLAGAPFFPWSLAFDGTDFYEAVGCDVCEGTLMRIPASGGAASSLGSGSFATVDEACVYSSTSEGIFSTPKH